MKDEGVTTSRQQGGRLGSWTEDKAMRELLSFRRVVGSVMREFLPEQARFVNLNELVAHPTVTLGTSGAERRSDSAWVAPLKKRGEMIGLAIESQSTPDPKMLERTLEYSSRLASQMRRDAGSERIGGRMPYVIPVVIYTGGSKGPWSAMTEWHGEPFDLPREMGIPYLAFFYFLICAADYEDYEGTDPGIALAMMIILAAGRDVALLACASVLRRLMEEGEAGRDLAFTIKMLFTVVALKKWGSWDFTSELVDLTASSGDVRSTDSELKRRELEMAWPGFERQIAEFEARGERLGLARAKTEVLKRLVERKFGESAWATASGFIKDSPGSSVAIEMFDWVLDCPSADEFLEKVSRSNGITSAPHDA